MSSLASPRASFAISQEFSISLALFATLCPCPELLITGLITHGNPIRSAAALSSSSVFTNSYGPVLSPNSSAANLRMFLRFMVLFTASAFGITLNPSASAAKSASILIASTSGRIKSGFSARITSKSASLFCILTTCARCATWCAGAFAYLSTAITSSPKRCASITTSLPSSPEPSNITFFAFDLSGAENCIYNSLSK